MTPVVILIVDISKLAYFLPVVLLYLFEPFLVSYVTVLVVRVGTFIAPGGTQISQDFTNIINFAQVSNLTLSLLTNVSATSIIATKSWYVRSILDLQFDDARAC